MIFSDKFKSIELRKKIGSNYIQTFEMIGRTKAANFALIRLNIININFDTTQKI